MFQFYFSKIIVTPCPPAAQTVNKSFARAFFVQKFCQSCNDATTCCGKGMCSGETAAFGV